MATPPIGSPVAAGDPARGSSISGARRKLRSVLPARSMRRSAISVARPGVAHADGVGPGAGAQPQAVAAVLARGVVEDGRPLEPDADLGPLDPAPGLVGDAPLHDRLGAIGGVAAEELAPELLLRRAAGSSARRARGRRTRARGASRSRRSRPGPWDRRATAGARRARPAAASAPAPRTRRTPRGARRSGRRARR